MSEVDRRLLFATLKLLRYGADVTPRLLSDVSGVSLSTVYYKIRNYYLLGNKNKKKEFKNG